MSASGTVRISGVVVVMTWAQVRGLSVGRISNPAYERPLDIIRLEQVGVRLVESSLGEKGQNCQIWTEWGKISP